MSFSRQVDEGQAAIEAAARDRPWLLTVFNVPDKMGGFMGRAGFRQTKKNPNHWWQIFDPQKKGERDRATAVRDNLLAANLRGKWKQVDRPTAKSSREYRRQDDDVLQRDAYHRAADAVRRARGG